VEKRMFRKRFCAVESSWCVEYDAIAVMGLVPGHLLTLLVVVAARKTSEGQKERRCDAVGSRRLQGIARVVAAAASGVQSPEEKIVEYGAGVVQVYRSPGLTDSQRKTLLEKAQKKVSPSIVDVEGELCFNISTETSLNSEEASKLAWYV